MDYLENLDSIYYVLIFGSIFTIGYLIIKRQDNFKLMIQYRLIIYGIIMVFIWYTLPSTPSLDSFGYPNNIDDIENKQKLLKYLQDYNHAIVKTTEALYWVIFFTVFWFISVVSSIIKHFKLEDSSK